MYMMKIILQWTPGEQTFACSILVDNSLDAKPPNTRECIAPNLADASMAMIASGIIGM